MGCLSEELDTRHTSSAILILADFCCRSPFQPVRTKYSIFLFHYFAILRVHFAWSSFDQAVIQIVPSEFQSSQTNVGPRGNRKTCRLQSRLVSHSCTAALWFVLRGKQLSCAVSIFCNSRLLTAAITLTSSSLQNKKSAYGLRHRTNQNL